MATAIILGTAAGIFSLIVLGAVLAADRLRKELEAQTKETTDEHL
ncbi:MAG: hypothetical protein RBR19_08285 [Sedimentisphaerales bacterium]|jgi:hypothetical protein|nr:hypothetical protein [Sedimentisphaerales bacterium]